MGFNFYKKRIQLQQFRKFPPVRNLEKKYMKNLTHVYALVKELFIKLPGGMSLPGWIRYFLQQSSKSILNIVKGLELKSLLKSV